MKIRKYIPLLILFILSFAALYLDLHHYFSFDTLKNHLEKLQQFLISHYLQSIAIYMFIYIAVVSLSIPGATFLTLCGGFFFGQWIGTPIVVISATVGACLIFLSAKIASSDFISQKTKGMALRMKNGFQQNALSYLLTLRLIPIFPFFAVNLAAALFQISLRTFALGTFVGIIPGTLVYVSMGVALQEVIQEPDFSPHIMLNPKILFALLGLGILSLLPVLYKYFKKNR